MGIFSKWFGPDLPSLIQTLQSLEVSDKKWESARRAFSKRSEEWGSDYEWSPDYDKDSRQELAKILETLREQLIPNSAYCPEEINFRKLGKLAPCCVRPLTRMVSDWRVREFVRVQAAEHLGTIGDRRAEPALQSAANQRRDMNLRKAAASALTRLGIRPQLDSIETIHEAAATGDIAALQQRLENGSSINARDNHGKTPLHWAAASASVQAVQYLIEHGANPDARDAMGRQAVVVAREHGKTDVEKFLAGKTNPLAKLDDADLEF